VEWDPEAAVTPLGHLAFFVEFLKLSANLMTALSYLSHTKRGKKPTEALVALGRKLRSSVFRTDEKKRRI